MPSSVIDHFSYDEKSYTLRIAFVTGLIYNYKDVPAKTYKMLKAAGSKGRYFNHYIKYKYEFKKAED